MTVLALGVAIIALGVALTALRRVDSLRADHNRKHRVYR